MSIKYHYWYFIFQLRVDLNYISVFVEYNLSQYNKDKLEVHEAFLI